MNYVTHAMEKQTPLIKVSMGLATLFISTSILAGTQIKADTTSNNVGYSQVVKKPKITSEVYALQQTTTPNTHGGTLQYEFHSTKTLTSPNVYIKLPDTAQVENVTVNNKPVETETYDLDGDNVLVVPATEAKDIIVKVNASNIEGSNTSTYAFLESETINDADVDGIHYDEGTEEQNHTFMHVLGAFELPMDSVVGTKKVTHWEAKDEPVDTQSMGYIQINGLLSGKDKKGKLVTESLANTTQWVGTELTVEKYEKDGKTWYDASDLISIIQSFKDMNDGYDIDYNLNKETGILTLSYTIKDSTLNESEFVENTDGTTETYMSKFNKIAGKDVHLRKKTNTVEINLAKYYNHIKDEKAKNPDTYEFTTPLKDVVKVNGVARSILPSKEYNYNKNPYGYNTNNIVLTWNLDK